MKDIYGINIQKKLSKKWGTPIYIQLAIIKMESDFDWLAKPPRQKIFKVIPFKRPSSSFGYSQAVKGTWEQYKKETGNKLASRARFKDSVDFIGWYTNKTETILKISKKMLLNNILLIMRVGEISNIIKKIKKLLNWQKKLKINQTFIKSNYPIVKNFLNKKRYIIF